MGEGGGGSDGSGVDASLNSSAPVKSLFFLFRSLFLVD